MSCPADERRSWSCGVQRLVLSSPDRVAEGSTQTGVLLVSSDALCPNAPFPSLSLSLALARRFLIEMPHDQSVPSSFQIDAAVAVVKAWSERRVQPPPSLARPVFDCKSAPRVRLEHSC